MKILVLSTVFPNPRQPLLGTFVKTRMFQAAKSCDLQVVAPAPWFPMARFLKPGYRPALPREEVQEGIRVHHPRFLSIPGIFKCLDGLFLSLSLIIPLLKIRKEFDFDLIDAHFAYPEGLGATLLGKWFRRPVTITLRGTLVPLSRFRLRRFQMIHALKAASAVFSVSDSLKKFAVSLGVSGEKIKVIPNGVDSSDFYPIPMEEARKKLSLPRDSKIIISVGGLVKRKGFHRVLNLMPNLLSAYPDLIYVIAGGPTVEGNFKPELDRIINEKKLARHVIFTGSLPRDKVMLWLNASDIFCLATSNEGWANVFFEAMACGKPVVTTTVGGNSEVVSSRELGILCLPGSPGDLEKNILKALKTPWDKEKISSHASAHDWESVASKVLKNFKEVIMKGLGSENKQEQQLS